ncbi:hypothetical protein SLEP1_g1703 [Rubroshorea leprosula]|uniref:C2 NT-type domain-containing protein n=1 Tax=Rubroshorea leprosula TaxID=152421 RepID=A0AAV5HEL4_9ROSI|nr:hypothetical protein SLEP1_g1703 [Rubroshorea leprosula]
MKWLQRTAMKRLHVKVRPLKLEGLCGIEVEDGGGKMVSVEMIWKGPNPGLLPFYRSSSNRQRNRSNQRSVGEDGSVEWDDEFERVCGFSIISKDPPLYGSWDVCFNILHGDNAKPKGKLDVLGKVPVDLSQIISKMECSEIKRTFPISLKVGGTTVEATLMVSLSFVEVRCSDDSPGIVQNSAESREEDGSFRIVKDLKQNEKKKKETNRVVSRSSESEESGLFDSDGLLGNESTTTCENSSEELSSGTELESTQSAPERKTGLFSWKRRRLSFSSSWRKAEPAAKNTGEGGDDVEPSGSSLDEPFTPWELREIISRDREAKLKANVFFASFDQRSDKAAGESACAALATVIADWLHSNPDIMPTRSEFDNLITEGSWEWQKLCNNTAYTTSFADKHFDLETILKADLRPVIVLTDKSFTGFFSPEKFESLKGLMSFDQIWDEISRNTSEYETGIYIVSWNDHFFVLKVEPKACYIFDSLGERLSEGCNRAYILKFDDSSLIYQNVEGKEGEENEQVLCSGKECCREYMKRFLAAIPVGELEVEERKGTVSASLHRKLQIDFHYSSCSSSSSATSSHFYCKEKRIHR